jgi:arginase
MALPKSVTIITAPYHTGVKNHRVGRGPEAFLKAGMVQGIKDNIPENVAVHVEEIEPVHEVPLEVEGDIGRSFHVLRNISEAVRRAVDRQSWPLVVSGNCMGTVGVYSGLNRPEKAIGQGLREVIWFDAHADLECPDTTQSGYLDGMGGRMLLGQGFTNLLSTIPGFASMTGSQLLGVGFRDYSKFEKVFIEEQGIRTVWGGKRVDCQEYAKALEFALANETAVPISGTVLHLDVDVLDTSLGKANEFAIEGGLGAKDLGECFEVIGRTRQVEALHVASLNPECEGSDNIARVGISAIVRLVQMVVGSRTQRDSSYEDSV